MQTIKPRVLLRVRKEDVKVSSFTKPDGMAECLECWKDYMALDDKNLSAPSMMLQGGADDGEDEPGGYESDPGNAQYKQNLRYGEATNTAINDLKPVWQWAIRKKCSITLVWNYPNINFITAAIDAEAELTKKLKINVVTAHLF